MYKTASRYGQRNPEAPPRQERDPIKAPWAVIAFRVGTDNRQRECVYRRVWCFRTEGMARQYWMDLDPCIYQDKRLLRLGVPVGSSAPSPIVERWIAQRKGINRLADCWVSAGYMRREQGDMEREWTEEVLP